MGKWNTDCWGLFISTQNMSFGISPLPSYSHSDACLIKQRIFVGGYFASCSRKTAGPSLRLDATSTLKRWLNLPGAITRTKPKAELALAEWLSPYGTFFNPHMLQGMFCVVPPTPLCGRVAAYCVRTARALRRKDVHRTWWLWSSTLGNCGIFHIRGQNPRLQSPSTSDSGIFPRPHS